MTDREVLLIAYGALRAINNDCDVLSTIEAHLFPPAQDKPSEPAPAPSQWPPDYAKVAQGGSAQKSEAFIGGPSPTTPVQREPGTPGADRPLKRSDVLISTSRESKKESGGA